MKTRTHNLGFPRIGPGRELKHALESFWAGKSDEAALQAAAGNIRRQNWQLQKAIGIDLIPSNDFSLYEHVLDTRARREVRLRRMTPVSIQRQRAAGRPQLETLRSCRAGDSIRFCSTT